MATMGDIVGRARVILADPNSVRWSDQVLLGYVNEGLAIARTVRPDLFRGQHATVQTPLLSSATFPLGMVYESHLVDYTAGRAHYIDAEHGEESRAAVLVRLFKAGLLGL